MKEDYSTPKEFDTSKKRHLIIDGDIVLYRICAVHDDDTESDREFIIRKANIQIRNLLKWAKVDTYKFYITMKLNFRNLLVDDYKLNRRDKPRPVNLQWAKEWAINNIGAEFVNGLEADDLLAINNKPNSIIWSIDKDIRQIPGLHLDNNTRKIYRVTEFGNLFLRNNKIYFDGMIGFYYQLMIGDSADFIVGCGKRVKKVYQSGAKKGEEYNSRLGIGPKQALAIIDKETRKDVPLEEVLINTREAVANQYRTRFGSSWQREMETQANLLFMAREYEEDSIKRWTYDDRVEYYNILTGEVSAYPT